MALSEFLRGRAPAAANPRRDVEVFAQAWPGAAEVLVARVARASLAGWLADPAELAGWPRGAVAWAGRRAWWWDGRALVPVPEARWRNGEDCRAWVRGKTWWEAWRTCHAAGWMLDGGGRYMTEEARRRVTVRLVRPVLDRFPEGDLRAAATRLLDALSRPPPPPRHPDDPIDTPEQRDFNALSEALQGARRARGIGTGEGAPPSWVWDARNAIDAVLYAWLGDYGRSDHWLVVTAGYAARARFADAPAAEAARALARMADVVREEVSAHAIVAAVLGAR